MRFKLVSGEEYSGRSYDDVVRAMADEKFDPVDALDVYRRSTADRFFEMFGIRPDPTTSETLIKSLCEAELMGRIED